MKSAIVATVLGAALALSASAKAADTLNVYTWSGYLPPEVVKQFEKENNVTVTVDNYDSNETLLAKLKLGGNGYDIVFPSNNFVPILIKEGLIQKVDAKDLPGYSNLVEKFQSPPWDPTGAYTIPFDITTTGIAVNTDVYKGDIDTYKILYEPPAELQGKINMFDTPSEVVAQASIYLGIPLCSDKPAEMQKVADLFTRLKPYIKTFSGKAGTIREGLAAGEIAISPLWSGSTQRTRKLRASIHYAYPKEGVLAALDTVAVPTGAEHVDLAKKFMAFLMRPETAGAVSNLLNYPNAVKGSDKFMDPQLSSSPEMNIPADRKVVFMETCSAEATKLQDRLWTNFMK